MLVGKSFQRPTFSCGTGCLMIFRCHFIEPCIDIAHCAYHAFSDLCYIEQGPITPERVDRIKKAQETIELYFDPLPVCEVSLSSYA